MPARTAAASAAAASAVVSAAGYTPCASFFCRTPGSVVALYQAQAKAHKENGDKAAAAVFAAAAKAAANA